MEDSKKVRAFFDRRARAFDSYYLPEDKSLFLKFLDFLFRGSIERRLRLTVEECSQEKDLTVLDVGCGSGRAMVRFLEGGAKEVTGVDFSPEMLHLARTVAAPFEKEGRCQFILGHFAELTFPRKFDVTVALGFFDYTRSPESYLRKMRELTSRKIIASFPARWRWRNIVRIVRLFFLGCPVYFYTPASIRRLLKNASIPCYTITNIGRDYFVVAEFS